jgi:chromosome segregation protein
LFAVQSANRPFSCGSSSGGRKEKVIQYGYQDTGGRQGMYFKRLELLGFKSFADETKVIFEPGITAIVGPNGCGKTNISDAIRWVLGEQSAKQLRGTKMDDIIFNGSGTRKPVSMAEVSLCLDNSGNVIPVDFNEIIITRRMFRSGETEYLINKTPCRLKDITELFLDTGIGPDAYSLIEASKIEMILSSKSEDRRFLFEEAAGIMKYKIRKNEALGKLAKTEENLIRLGDIIQEIKSRVSSLDYQVRKAQQYQKYKQGIKTIEIGLLVRELREINGNFTATAVEFNRLKDDIEQLTVQVNQEEAEVAKMRFDLGAEEEKILSVQNELSRINGELERKEERLNNLKEKKESLVAEEAQLKKEINSAEDKLNRLKEKSEATGKEKSLLNEEIKKKEELLKEKEEALSTKAGELEEITGNLEKGKETVFNLLGEVSGRRNELTSLSVNLKNIQVQAGKLKQEKNNIQDVKNEMAKRIEDIQASIRQEEVELASRIAGRNHLIQDTKHKEDSYKHLSEAFEKAQEDWRVKSARNESLEKLQANFEGYDTGVKEILSKNLPGVHGTVASLIGVQAEFEAAIEAVLGDQLQYVIVQNIDSARDAVDYLTQQNKGRVNFLVLDDFAGYKAPKLNVSGARYGIELVTFDEKYRPVMEYLLGNVLVAGNFDAALAIARSAGFRGKAVTLKGELVEKTLDKSLVIGGGTTVREASFLGRQAEIRELGEYLLGISNNINKLKTDRDTVEQLLKNQSGELEKINLEIQKLQLTLDNNRQNVEKLTQDKNNLDKQEETLSVEDTLWVRESEQATSSINNINGLISDLERQVSEHQEITRRLEKDIQDKAGMNAQMTEEVTGVKIKLAQDKQKQVNILAQIERSKEEIDELNELLESKKAEISSLSARGEAIATSKEEENTRLATLGDEKIGTEKILNEIRENRHRLTMELKKKEDSIRATRNRAEERKNVFHQQELKNAQLSARSEEIKKKMVEDYQFHDDAIDLHPEVTIDVEEQKMELGRLKKKMESMGPVNLVAIDEYQELEERYKFLLKQQEDLIKAREDLHEVINKTNATARQNFQETFEKIRTNFISISKQLFEGGEANLILADTDNLLETGIDIVVQPPGKKLESISLLSAGEKALTAIALLFSIFMVKPSPFCVLDEIDAPLDESNLLRFTRMLKEFAKQSQFIVVTHNKRTMEQADILYGVTMEEFGVSKLVSVKFKEEETAEAIS